MKKMKIIHIKWRTKNVKNNEGTGMLIIEEKSNASQMNIVTKIGCL
jgi:hypothetical protein